MAYLPAIGKITPATRSFASKAFNCDALTTGKHFDLVVRRCIWIVVCQGLVPYEEGDPLRRTILNAHVASSLSHLSLNNCYLLSL